MTISPKWITIGRRAAEWLTGCRCRRGCSPGSLTHSRSQAAHLCIARRTGLTDDAVWRSSIGAACRPIQATPHPDSPVACKSSPQRLDSGRAPPLDESAAAQIRRYSSGTCRAVPSLRIARRTCIRRNRSSHRGIRAVGPCCSIRS